MIPSSRCRRRISVFIFSRSDAIERAERLVHEEQPWFENDGAGQRNPLLLATGKLRWQAVPEATETDAME